MLISRTAAIALTLLALQGCRLTLEVGPGGQIITANNQDECAGGETCTIEVEPGSGYIQNFYPLPDEGNIFAGWQRPEGIPALCTDSMAECTFIEIPAFSGFDLDVEFFLVPKFIDKYADLEATGNVVRPGPNYLQLCTYEEDVNNDNFGCELKYFPEYGTGLNLYDYVPTDNDVLLTDYVARAGELAALSDEELNAFCPSGGGTFDTNLNPPPSGPGPNGELTGFFVIDPFASYFPSAAQTYLYHSGADREAARDFIIRHALLLAENRSFLDINTGDGLQSIPAIGILNGLTMAWHVIRDSVEDEVTQQTVDQYLAQFMRRVAMYDVELTAPNIPYQLAVNEGITNRGYQRDWGAMLYGIHADNKEYFQRGIARYFAALDVQTRPDGSLIRQSQRGADAIGYSIETLGYMVMMAETAWYQGYDLYSVSVNGRSLDTMIEYHVSALEDPTILQQYTQYRNPSFCNDFSGNCDEDQWATQRLQDIYPGDYSLLSALQVYLARFPDKPLSERIRAVMPSQEFYPLIWDTGGGRQACHYQPVN